MVSDLSSNKVVFINGMVFADESKMRFRDHPNKQIDIEWCFRGDASEANWHEAPRHCTQI